MSRWALIACLLAAATVGNARAGQFRDTMEDELVHIPGEGEWPRPAPSPPTPSPTPGPPVLDGAGETEEYHDNPDGAMSIHRDRRMESIREKFNSNRLRHKKD